MPEGKKPEFFIQWDTSNRCNLGCRHCYHTEDEDDEQLSTEQAKAMLDDLKACTDRWGFRPFIHFSGGEPMLREDLPELARYAAKLGVGCRMLSNGTLITGEKATELKDAGITRVQVSIDGNRETHNRIRDRQWAYDRALEGVRNASGAGIKVNVACTLMRSNLGQFEDVIRAGMESGAKIAGFKRYVPSSPDDPEFPSTEEIHAEMRSVDGMRKKYEGRMIITKSEVLWNIIYDDSELKRKGAAEDLFCGGCGAGFNGISVISNGDVYPCRRLPVKMGKISDGLYRLFIENRTSNELRDFHRLKGCGECDNVTYCRGCRAIAYAVTGDYMAKDPQCTLPLVRAERPKAGK